MLTPSRAAVCVLAACRYATGILREEWSPASVLGMGELLKFCISLAAIAMRTSASEAPEGPIAERLSYLLRHSAKMAVPAVLYLIMNTLGLYAIACTEPEPP